MPQTRFSCGLLPLPFALSGYGLYSCRRFTQKELQNRRHDEALKLLLLQVNKPQATIGEQAVLAFMIALSYERQQQQEKAIYYYTLSATNDVKSATHKHTSLHSLAKLLFNKGDIGHAYNYIKALVKYSVANWSLSR